jgi:membrane associated rhomboid family serine protease
MTPMASSEQTQTMVCYRHPRAETAVSCSNCGRPICTDCMVFSAVGIKCPECAGQATGPKKAAKRVRSVAGQGTGFIVTKTLIAINVVVYLLQATNGGTLTNPAGEVFQRGFLRAYEVANGEWWRLVTNAFLHGSPVHLLFNILMLWWFGRLLEEMLGRGRFLAVYFISVLAGSAGALLLAPTAATIGASGAVFGILGAGLVLERHNINVFGGTALFIVLFNLSFTLVVHPSYISIGGHLGGLVGGCLAVLVLSRFGRGHAIHGRFDLVTAAGLAGIAVVSIALSLVQASGYA